MITCISENKLKKGKLRWENFNFQLRIVNKFTKYCVIILANPHLPSKFKMLNIVKIHLFQFKNKALVIKTQTTHNLKKKNSPKQKPLTYIG